ncbi:thioredoxin-like protein [Rhizophagus clarus]|uniref:Thioredoxin-like protein n=1 Tax=Rhizophagus clarus TaxID=94130 RepID=A0A8H3LS45_9GLOM|nr:thioredoxin-like protein [Rhizophagus clarus]
MNSIVKKMKQPTVEFFYDLQCPWAYIASKRIEQITGRAKAKVIWTPVLLEDIYKAINGPQDKGSVMPLPKRQYIMKDLMRTVQRYNIELKFHPRHPIQTIYALRLLHATPQSHRAALTHAFYRLYWIDNADISDPSLLLNTARSLKIPYDEPLDSSIFSNEKYHNSLSSSTARAVKHGAPGVPSFWLEQYPGGGRLYWGQDRLHFVEAALTSISTNVPLEQMDLLKFYPRCSVENKLNDNKKKVKTLKFWFDLNSTYSYIAYTQLSWIKKQANCEVNIEYMPFLLGVIFERIGTPQTPLLKLNETRKAYDNKDMHEWIRFWNQVGNKFKFRLPDVFPIGGINAARILLLEPKTIECIYKACWVDNIPIGTSNDLLIETLNKSGFDGNALLQATQQNVNNVKDKLKENTERALKLGMFGAPVFQVDDGELVWGQDRINVVLDLLDGWTWQNKDLETMKNNDEKSKL